MLTKLRQQGATHTENKCANNFSYIFTSCLLSPHCQKFELDISNSIHGLAPSLSPQHLNPEKLLDGEDNHEHGSRGSATTYCLLCSSTTG